MIPSQSSICSIEQPFAQQRLINGIAKPSLEQRQQMGKTVHALAVPCVTGAAGLAYADHFALTGANIFAVISLLLGTLTLLALGNLMLEGDSKSM
jgi:hypothetical protein